MAGRAFRDISNAYGAVAVVPSDSTVIPTARSLYIGVTGNLAVRMARGNLVTFTNVPVGMLPVQVDQVLATGTTATEMLALY